MKKVTKVIDNFKNVKGLNKDKARELMVNAIKIKTGTILTLPYKKAIIEKMILEKISKKINFIGYEYKREVFWELCKTIGNEKLPISPIFGSIGEAIFKAEPNQYSNLLLDYCGVLDTFAKEIEHAIKNNIIQVGGMMAITLSKIGILNEYGVIGEIFRSMPKEMFKSDIGETELGVKLFFNKILTNNYNVETVFNYSDMKENGEKGMAMILIIIRRNA